MRRGTTPIFSFVFNLNYLVVFSPFTVFSSSLLNLPRMCALRSARFSSGLVSVL